jgi:O-antigen ligase
VDQNNTCLNVSVAVLAGSLLLGGGTRGGLLSDVALQLLCLPVLVHSLGRSLLPRPAAPVVGVSPAPTYPNIPASRADAAVPLQLRNRRIGPAMLLIALCCLLPVLQLIPLPRAWWAALPGRDLAKAAFSHIGLPVPEWLPLSVAPHATWQSLLALIPPLAVFFSVIQLSGANRRRLSVVVLAIAVISVFVGLAQLAQGTGSRLRFYEITNDTEAVGFFANRNHFAALLYCAILLAAAWALELTRSFEAQPPERRFEAGSILPLLAIFTVLVALLAAQSTTRSRAGLGLTILAVAGGFALAFPDRRRVQRSGMSARVLIGTIGIAAFMAVQLSLYRILERFATDPMADPRVIMARNTIAAAKSFMPFGSGIGTFVPVYAAFERPDDVLSGVYVNRAHNDFLEVWLETGVVGPALSGLFLLWLLDRIVHVWRSAEGGRAIDHALARSGTLMIVLLIAHSASDYPLRTGGLMAMFAFAAALSIAPPDGADAAEQAADGAAAAKLERDERRSQHRGQRRAATAATADAAAAAAARKKSHPPASSETRAGKTGTSRTSSISAAEQAELQPWPTQTLPIDPVKSTDWPEAWRTPAGGRSEISPKPSAPTSPSPEPLTIKKSDTET